MPFELIEESLDLRHAIAHRLRVARQHTGLSQRAVSEHMSLHRETITEMEAGRRGVLVEELILLARVYGVSVEWLACGGLSSGAGFEPHDRMATS
jgi:transcriptional regulator with XRE-family HTH domain